MSSSNASPARVRFFMAGSEFDPTDPRQVLNRVARRLLKSTGDKQGRKYGGLVHPETGERPDVHLVIADPTARDMQVRLVTDSVPLRDWLKAKGIVVGDASPVRHEAA